MNIFIIITYSSSSFSSNWSSRCASTSASTHHVHVITFSVSCTYTLFCTGDILFIIRAFIVVSIANHGIPFFWLSCHGLGRRVLKRFCPTKSAMVVIRILLVTGYHGPLLSTVNINDHIVKRSLCGKIDKVSEVRIGRSKVIQFFVIEDDIHTRGPFMEVEWESRSKMGFLGELRLDKML
jgi:hypothetical protein